MSNSTVLWNEFWNQLGNRLILPRQARQNSLHTNLIYLIPVAAITFYFLYSQDSAVTNLCVGVVGGTFVVCVPALHGWHARCFIKIQDKKLREDLENIVGQVHKIEVSEVDWDVESGEELKEIADERLIAAYGDNWLWRGVAKQSNIRLIIVNHVRVLEWLTQYQKLGRDATEHLLAFFISIANEDRSPMKTCFLFECLSDFLRSPLNIKLCGFACSLINKLAKIQEIKLVLHASDKSEIERCLRALQLNELDECILMGIKNTTQQYRAEQFRVLNESFKLVFEQNYTNYEQYREEYVDKSKNWQHNQTAYFKKLLERAKSDYNMSFRTLKLLLNKASNFSSTQSSRTTSSQDNSSSHTETVNRN